MNILFVCTGNICRSPAAEAVLRSRLGKLGIGHLHSVDSAGTMDYHIGESADPRMILHGKKRGYVLDSRARQFDHKKDFSKFDLILCASPSHMRTLKRMASDSSEEKKILPMNHFSKKLSVSEVPDPYYGGPQGFEEAFDIIEDICDGICDYLSHNPDLKQPSLFNAKDA